jgi:NCAIR mutase (PurE)-related protein
MNPIDLKNLLQQVKDGDLDINDAIEKLRHLPFEDLGFARVDHHRHIRCGFPEVIYCPGKTDAQIVEIFQLLAEKGNNVIASRADEHVFKAIQKNAKLENAAKLRYDSTARMVVLAQQASEASDEYIAVVTAGTADMPVAAEAKLTAEMMGQRVELICDVGVAGIHRLLDNKDTLQTLTNANVVIVVAGMEGALASVVGGLVDCPVIAVPTSVGYGANFEGLAALLAMLNSCASGVTVVNIDNGFGAGYSASLINRKIRQKETSNGKDN